MSFFIRKGGAGAKNSLTGGKKKRSFQDGSKSKKFKANKVKLIKYVLSDISLFGI